MTHSTVLWYAFLKLSLQLDNKYVAFITNMINNKFIALQLFLASDCYHRPTYPVVYVTAYVCTPVTMVYCD